MNILSGQIIIMTTGEYSDYLIQGLFRALKSFNDREAYASFYATRCDKYGNKLPQYIWSFQNYEFIPWLITEKYIVEIESHEYVEVNF